MKSLNFIVSILLLATLVACAKPPDATERIANPTSAPQRTVSTTTNGTVTAIEDMLTERAAHTATLLPDGRVLLAGGFDAGGNSLSSAELFDPATSTFSATDPLSVARQSHTATRLQNGKILITGGYGHDSEYLDSAELFDPVTETFSPIGHMVVARAGHVAIQLNDGTILIAGGVGTGWTFLDSAELFDPNENTFTPTGTMTTARESHTATLLEDGKVLITGGHKGRQSSTIIYASAELYDPATGLFSATGDMLTKRHKHDAVLLGDGRVLVAGGADERDERGQYSSAELYDPRTGNFSMAGDMNATRYKFQGTSILLETGAVLLMGGAPITEIYDPATNSFSEVVDGLGTTRLFASTTSLSDGKVILTGGYGTNVAASADAWIFQP
jgi:hypothetical protein